MTATVLTARLAGSRVGPTRLVLTLTILLLCGPFLRAQGAHSPWMPVTKDDVIQAISADLRARGVSADNLPKIGDIDLPLAVPVLPGATLRVTEFCWDSNLGRQQFRIECQPAGQCVSFFAYVEARRSETIAHPCQRTLKLKTKSEIRKPVIHAGDRVALVYHGERMRVTTLVVCLDRGAEGEVIRVRNQDGHIFRARISSATLLEALPQ